MINRVVAKNFKGREIDIEIGPKTLICGPNGTGKSAIVQALELAINGHVSGGTYKTNGAILEAFGRNDKLTVEASIKTAGNGSTQLARQFAMDAKGAVGQLFLVDRRRTTAKEFMTSAGAAGAPKVVVVDDFLQLTPSKMIAYLAAFAGGEDLEKLESQVVTETTKKNSLQAKKLENDAYISRTMAGIAELGLPAGTLAETQASIKLTTKSLAKAKAELKEAEKAEADRLAEVDRKAKEAAKAEMDRQDEEKRKEEELAKKVLEDNAQQAVEHREDTQDAFQHGDLVAHHTVSPIGKVLTMVAPKQEVVYPTQEEHFGPPSEPWKPHQGLTAISSLKKILDAIDGLQCPTCGSGYVRMVVVQEIKKWGGR